MNSSIAEHALCNGVEIQHDEPAESIYIQGIRRALGVGELIKRISNAAELKKQYLEQLKAKIEERKKSKLYVKEFDDSLAIPYNFKEESPARSWIQAVFQEEEETDTDSDGSVTEEDYREMLKLHKCRKRCKTKLEAKPLLAKYMYYSSDFITRENKWSTHQKNLKKNLSKKFKSKSKKKSNSKTNNETNNASKSLEDSGELQIAIKQESVQNEEVSSSNSLNGRDKSSSPVSIKKKKQPNIDTIRKRHWKMIAKKDIPKAYRIRTQLRSFNLGLLRRASREGMKRQRANASLSIKISKDKAGRARRITREMQLFWKKYSKVEKVHRKKAEKHALEQIRLDEEMREAKRQQRKLNFLISQTELFAHFISKKLDKAQDGMEADKRIESIMSSLEKDYVDKDVGVSASSEMHSESDEDDHDGSYYCDKALKNVKRALDLQSKQTTAFDNVSEVEDNFSDQYRLVNPSISASGEITQPSLFRGQLKSYQLKGMNWLINLYEQGINGILADEMGLGKTVQTIAFFGHLAEKINIWGPFLVVAPASTLNNWHQEFTKFFPDFKVLPYWGNTSDRKVLRKFWNLKASNHSDRHSAPFHVLITSYQLVISDVRYFQRIKWQYMVLDEAQAVKSSSSVRWKVLLDFNCRNRLLLTGTPIQNTMAELWALLHFIMPSLFDSHNEFNEWFSKDIENHIENKSNIDETQLSRLHMILKPFMLRRIKRDVENELSEKIEVRVHCSLTPRQKALYNAVKQKIRIEDLVKSNGVTYIATGTGGNTTLMNIVMQFRKVCNHPDLFERRKVTSPYHFDSLPAFILPKLIYNKGFLSRVSPGRRKLLYCDMNIHHPYNIHKSIGGLSFVRLLNMSISEYWSIMARGHQKQWSIECERTHQKAIVYLKDIFHSSKNCNEAENSVTHISCKELHSLSLNPADLSNFGASSPLKRLIFTQNDSYTYTHSSSVIKNFDASSKNKQEHLEPVTIPKILRSMYFPPLTANVKGIYCNDSNACIELSRNVLGDMLLPMLYGPTAMSDSTEEIQQIVKTRTFYCKQAKTGSGLTAFTPSAGWSNIRIPNKEYLVTDSGKMYALDILLKRLKNNGHRVLIYSQMTRMIDILEEYMWYRGHTYIRLDGSSRISERRDMVADFQSRSDIFAFLLSTRAGGLGINLTAADTVIFYDSDWNPTVDQQAMDRAHRLGQTKQVTVYRLVCQGTVDERILQRAEEKNAIQRMVIAGGSFKPDALKPREVVSLLLDDEQLMQRLKSKREESKGEALPYKGKKRGRKTNAEREAKRVKELQEQGITDSSEHITIDHSGSSSPADTSMFESKFVAGTSTPQDFDSESGSYFDSMPASPASGISACSDQRSLEDDLIVIDDNELPSPFNNTRTLSVRGRGCIRGRGRPRIRPLMPEATKRRYNRSISTTSSNRGSVRGRRATRVKRMFTGRAAAMAGARAGAVAASAATYATYGYGLEPTADSILQQKDKTVSNPSSMS